MYFMNFILKLQIMFVDIVQGYFPWLTFSLTKEPENLVKHESTKAAGCFLGMKKAETDGSGYEDSYRSPVRT